MLAMPPNSPSDRKAKSGLLTSRNMPKISLRAAARALNRARKHASGGHQGRKPGAISRTKPRCPCGKMTLQRAQARGRSPEHRPGCQFYPLEDFGSPSPRIRKSPRRTVYGVGVARGTEAPPVAVATRLPGGEPEGPPAVLPEVPGEGPTETTHQVLEPSARVPTAREPTTRDFGGPDPGSPQTAKVNQPVAASSVLKGYAQVPGQGALH